MFHCFLVMLVQSSLSYRDFFSDTWKAFTKHPIIRLKDYAGKRVSVWLLWVFVTSPQSYWNFSRRHTSKLTLYVLVIDRERSFCVSQDLALFFFFWGRGWGLKPPTPEPCILFFCPFFLASFNILHCCIISLHFSCFQPL